MVKAAASSRCRNYKLKANDMTLHKSGMTTDKKAKQMFNLLN